MKYGREGVMEEEKKIRSKERLKGGWKEGRKEGLK